VTSDLPRTGTPSANGAGSATTTTTDGHSKAPVLRPDKPPVDQLDFDDRHDTRATESDEMVKRYAELHKDRRRNDWHHLAMGLVVFIVGVTVYLVDFVVVSQLLPHLNPRLVTQIVGLAFIAAGGGVAVRSAGQALKRRYASHRSEGHCCVAPSLNSVGA
jgi:hypothetical protein